MLKIDVSPRVYAARRIGFGVSEMDDCRIRVLGFTQAIPSIVQLSEATTNDDVQNILVKCWQILARAFCC